MKPVDMIVKHDPENGTWGDCTRCCVASIFELPAEEVPHFAEGGDEDVLPDGLYPYWHKMEAWLNERGFSATTVCIPNEESEPHAILMRFHYIRSGRTRRGTDHDTVWFGDKMVHDPRSDDPSGVLPNVYPQWVTLIVKA